MQIKSPMVSYQNHRAYLVELRGVEPLSKTVKPIETKGFFDNRVHFHVHFYSKESCAKPYPGLTQRPVRLIMSIEKGRCDKRLAR